MGGLYRLKVSPAKQLIITKGKIVPLHWTIHRGWFACFPMKGSLSPVTRKVGAATFKNFSLPSWVLVRVGALTVQWSIHRSQHQPIRDQISTLSLTGCVTLDK